MKTAKVTFHKVVVHEQVLGGSDECIISTLFFDLEIDGEKFESLSVPMKQVVGTAYTDKAIEVGSPEGYGGPFNYDYFRKAAADYYRIDVGAFASLLKIYENNKVHIKGCVFEQEITFEMPLPESP